MYTKAKIFNLALGVLLLQRQIANPDTDTSNECKVLNTHWPTAFRKTIEDLDLDSMSSQKVLELITADPTDYPEWKYVYKYPSKCAFFRRIKSCVTTDNRSTKIPKLVRLYNGEKAIFTNEQNAIAEYIPDDIDLTQLSANVGLCIAHYLALLSSPLVTGKGADKLRKEIEARYVALKGDAQEQDRNENFNYEDDVTQSEFVESRYS